MWISRSNYMVGITLAVLGLFARNLVAQLVDTSWFHQWRQPVWGLDLVAVLGEFRIGLGNESWPTESCPTVKNILLLDSEGKRVAVKYYSDDWPTNSAKLAFEKSVFTKTLKSNARVEVSLNNQQPPLQKYNTGFAEIAMFENNIVIYKFVQDLHFFVTGGDDENELILATVLQGFFDAVSLLLRNTVDKREALENLDLILLCLDEIVDGGMILETDASVIAGKVATHSMDADAPLSEQTINSSMGYST
uniref:Coatomer subunit zeta n=1 Tax=Fagus sylvatica TaxID=28930 RepID=A0A2N9ET59_FAGSY